MTEADHQQTKALVLGGGGPTGIAWEMGVILGLHDGGIDVVDADMVVGTSAGSVVGAQITSGFPLEQLYAPQLQPVEDSKEQAAQFDMTKLFPIFTAGIGAPDVQTARARVGAAALAAQTMPSGERLEIIMSRLPAQEWPQKQRLVTTAVDTESGEWVTFDRDAGVPLALAIAASCAVPGIYPPIAINGHRYMDGGMRSGTNADFATGYKRVLILRAEVFNISALDPEHTTPFETFEDEVATLERAGSQSLVITPNEASVEARGPNPFDISRRAISAQAGREQGRQLAESVKRFWIG